MKVNTVCLITQNIRIFELCFHLFPVGKTDYSEFHPFNYKLALIFWNFHGTHGRLQQAYCLWKASVSSENIKCFRETEKKTQSEGNALIAPYMCT